MLEDRIPQDDISRARIRRLRAQIDSLSVEAAELDLCFLAYLLQTASMQAGDLTLHQTCSSTHIIQ